MTNRLLKDELGNYPNLEFIDMEDALTLENGIPDSSKFQASEANDRRLNLNNAGYALWGAALAPQVLILVSAKNIFQ